MDDLISRRAAIDTIRASTSKYTGFMEMEMYTDDDAVEAIEALPSAQPEIIRCKDCRHGVDYYHEGDCYCTNPKWGLRYFGGSWKFYCADAEKGEEHGTSRAVLSQKPVR